MRSLQSSPVDSQLDSVSFFVRLLNEHKILQLNYESDDQDMEMKFAWQIVNFTAFTMDIELRF